MLYVDPHFWVIFLQILFAGGELLAAHMSIPYWSLENHISGLKDAMGKRQMDGIFNRETFFWQ